MKWVKKGLILDERKAGQFGLVNTQVPYGCLFDDHIRIFFGARKAGDASASIYYMNVAIDEPLKILDLCQSPILEKGKLGAFDQDGVLPVCVKKVGTEIYLYYGGFTKYRSGTHTCMLGLAKSSDDGRTFKRVSDGPILPISSIDPFLIGSADIVFDGTGWHMIYTSGTAWSKLNDSLEISYTLKYAHSVDGIAWSPTGRIIIPHESLFDAYSKPAIFRMDDQYIMYFSKRQIVNYRVRGDAAYSLRMAVSKDLLNWERQDEKAGIGISESGWDSEMICYPSVIETPAHFFMLYNGNGFGKSGFGLAEISKSKTAW